MGRKQEALEEVKPREVWHVEAQVQEIQAVLYFDP